MCPVRGLVHVLEAIYVLRMGVIPMLAVVAPRLHVVTMGATTMDVHGRLRLVVILPTVIVAANRVSPRHVTPMPVVGLLAQRIQAKSPD